MRRPRLHPIAGFLDQFSHCGATGTPGEQGRLSRFVDSVYHVEKPVEVTSELARQFAPWVLRRLESRF